MKVTYERDTETGNGYQAWCGVMEWNGGKDEIVAGTHFEAMIRQINKNMPEEDTELVFIRSDKPGSVPYVMGAELTALVKNDPEKAIEALSFPDVRIELGRNPPSTSNIRTCSETLAAAFGERVLIRRREGRLECPCCGRWVNEDVALVCQNCKVSFLWEPCDSQWVSIRVLDLLAAPCEKFFLPRDWNGFKPWIERGTLRDMYNEFLVNKEKFNDDEEWLAGRC